VLEHAYLLRCRCEPECPESPSRSVTTITVAEAEGVRPHGLWRNRDWLLLWSAVSRRRRFVRGVVHLAVGDAHAVSGVAIEVIGLDRRVIEARDIRRSQMDLEGAAGSLPRAPARRSKPVRLRVHADDASQVFSGYSVMGSSR
jgi:hypothetical protein